MPGAAIRDLEIRPARRLEDAAGDLDGDRAGRDARVLDGVVAEVPEDLVQVRRIHAHFDIGVRRP